MANQFTRTIDRAITIPSNDPGLDDTEWVLTIGPSGVTSRRKGETESVHLTWRQIIGHALIHSGGRRNVEAV